MLPRRWKFLFGQLSGFTPHHFFSAGVYHRLKNGAGFTLVELLVVMALIASLFSTGTYLVSKSARDRANDATRLSNIEELKKAAELYYQDHNCYPLPTPFAATLSSGAAWTENTTVYMRKVPKDPTTNAAYSYRTDTASTCPQWMVLYADLNQTQTSLDACPLPTYAKGASCTPAGFDATFGCVSSGRITCGAPVATATSTGIPTGAATATPTRTPTPSGMTPIPNTPTVTPTPAGCSGRLGNYAAPGAVSDNADTWSNYKAVAGPFAAPGNCTFNTITAYIDGKDAGLDGNVRGVLYMGATINTAQKIAESNAVLITSGTPPFPVDFPFTNNVTLTSGNTYWLALHSGSGRLRIYYRTGTSKPNYNVDDYSNGASDPFGAATSGTQDYIIYATLNPPASLIAHWRLDESGTTMTAADSVGTYTGNLQQYGGLAGWWKLDEASGQQAADSSGNNNGGIIAGTTVVAGQSGFGNARSFNGTSSDNIRIPNIPSISGNNATISVWVNTSSVPASQSWIAGQSGRAQMVVAGGKVTFASYLTDNFYGASDPSNIPTNEWTHYVGTLSSSGGNTTMTLYKNGTLVAQNTYAKLPSSNNSCLFWIGGVNETSPCVYSGQYFNALIDEVRVYGRTLSASEVVKVMLNTAPVQWTPAVSSNGLNFNGLNQYINVPQTNSLHTPTMSVSGWFKAKTLTYGAPIYNRRTPSNQGGVTLEIGSSNSMCWYVYTNTWNSACSDANSVTANTWFHVVGSYDGINLRLYLNGTLVKTTAASGLINNPSSPNIWIGRNIAGQTIFFDGIIDDVRIYNGALTAADVTALYATYTVPTPPPPPASLQGHWKLNETTGLSAADSSGNANTGTFTVYGIAGHWKLDESSGATVADSSGNNFTGTATGTTIQNPSTSGAGGNARVFNGTSDNINMGTTVGNFATTDPFSVSVWINPTVIGGNRGIVTRESGGYIGWHMRLSASNTVRFILASSGADYAYADSPVLTAGKWYHLVGTWNGSIAKVYVNGTSSSTPVSAGTLGTITGSRPLYIGYEPSSLQYFSGVIDEVRLYNRALSDTEAANLYSNFVPQWTQGADAGSLEFDGVDDFVLVPNNANLQLTTNFTISAWIRPSTTGNTPNIPGNFGAVVCKGLNAGDPDYILYAGYNGNIAVNSGITSRIGFWDGSAWQGAESGPTIATGVWSHIAVTYDGTNYRYYMNGLSVGSDQKAGGGSIQTSTFPLYLGQQCQVPANPFNGRIDDVRIYNGSALSATEINDLYSNYAPPSANSTQTNINAAIAPKPVTANGTTLHTITLTTDDPNGGYDVKSQHSAINVNTPYRGFIGWSNIGFPDWVNNPPAFDGSPIPCLGGGQGAVYGGAAGQYVNIVSCTTSVSDNRRTSTLNVIFDPSFLDPATNDLSIWSRDVTLYPAWGVGWNIFDTFGLTGCPGNCAQFISQTVPTTMTAGSSNNVSITMRNVGTTTWSSSDQTPHQLGSQNPTDNVTWGVNRINLSSSVSPGSNVTFNFNVQAPSTGGSYNFQWRMAEEGVQWFGDYTSNVVVNVTCTNGYKDVDFDEYGAGAYGCYGGTGFQVVSNNTDCYDSNASAKPGQTSYFTNNRGDGSFDYNCSGTADLSGSYVIDSGTTIYTTDIKGVCGVSDGYTGTSPINSSQCGVTVCLSYMAIGPYYSDSACTQQQVAHDVTTGCVNTTISCR